MAWVSQRQNQGQSPVTSFSDFPTLSLVAVLGHTSLSGVMGLSEGQESGGLHA